MKNFYRFSERLGVKKYINVLNKFDVDVIFDIRKRFLIRDKGFMPKTIQKVLERHNFKYMQYNKRYGSDVIFSLIECNNYNNICFLGNKSDFTDEMIELFFDLYEKNIYYYNEKNKLKEIEFVF